MSYQEWLSRYNQRVQPIIDRMHKLPAQKIEPWWAPECERGEAPSRISSRGMAYRTQGHEVDLDIPPEWVERLNSIPNIEIVHVCAGHPAKEGAVYPSVEFVVQHPKVKGGNGDGDAVHYLMQQEFGDLTEAGAWEVHKTGAGGYAGYPEKVLGMLWSYVPRVWMSDCEFASWWEQIIGRLENWSPALPLLIEDLWT